MFFGPGHAEGKTRVHHQSNFGARVGSGFQVCGPNRKILGGLPLELARVLAYSIGLPGHVRGVHFVFGFVFLIARLVRGPGTRDFARTCLARRAEGRGGYSYKTLARRELCMCRGQPLQCRSSLLVRESRRAELATESDSDAGSRGGRNSRGHRSSRTGPPRKSPQSAAGARRQNAWLTLRPDLLVTSCARSGLQPAVRCCSAARLTSHGP